MGSSRTVRSPVNEAGLVRLVRLALPAVNGGPNTACGGKGRERPWMLGIGRRRENAPPSASREVAAGNPPARRRPGGYNSARDDGIL
jgi:hypothetical protein